MSLVVNMLGGPGRGKSTAAFTLIGRLKTAGYKAELLTEYVKWPAYKVDRYELADQLYLLAQHNHRLSVLSGLVDIVVTDTSLLNSIAYTTSETQQKLAVELYTKYHNINFIVPRKKLYMNYGRSQTEDEAKSIDGVILAYINNEIDLSFAKTYDLSDDDTFNDTIYRLVTNVDLHTK
jgi:hypothetical protein